jgi:hypothetical protein
VLWSLSEIVDDLKIHSEEEVLALIQKRWRGLQLLRKRLGDATIDFRPYGGYELFCTRIPTVITNAWPNFPSSTKSSDRFSKPMFCQRSRPF